MSDLDQANQAIALLEGQLQAHFTAVDHPRWDTGELVLVGDVGQDRAGNEGQVFAITGPGATVSVSPDSDTVTVWSFADCVALVSRGRLPH